MYIDFEPIEKPVVSKIQLLDLHGIIKVQQTELGAHINMENGIPLTLEICCFSQGGWDGSNDGYSIDN